MVLSIAVIILAIYVSLRIYQGQEREIANLKKQAQNEAKSNEIFKNLTLLDDKINVYKRSLKIKSTGEVMNSVSKIAKNAGFKIDSIRPMGESGGEDYVRFSVSAVISAKSYNQIGEFMSRLENDRAFFSVDSFKINRDSQAKGLVLNFRVSVIKVAD
ncbi:MAG: type 4a pilus biogenesis protein PilO [Candidatus Omnitrophota bacterium]